MNKEKYPCKDAFLTNPVASANESTGYTVTNPPDKETAENYSRLCVKPPAGIKKTNPKDIK